MTIDTQWRYRNTAVPTQTFQNPEDFFDSLYTGAIDAEDIKKHKDIVDLYLHKNEYKCRLTDKNEILITNTKGQCISSDLSKCTRNLNKKQKDFAFKILAFAEIALGKAA